MHSLATIADLYNPTLLIICLGITLHRSIIKKDRYGFKLIFCALIVYSLMFADQYLQLWPYFGLDYSTHTASALAMCIYIGAAARKLTVGATLGLSLLAYGELMVILHYHSWSDIVSTAAVIALLVTPLFKPKSTT